MLFLSDDGLTAAQRASAKAVEGMTEQQRREALDNLREQRMHTRLREFAWWLFIAPGVFGLLIAAAHWLIAHVLTSQPAGFGP